MIKSSWFQKQIFTLNSNSIARYVIATCTAATKAATQGADGYTDYCCPTDFCNESLMKLENLILTMAVIALTFVFFH